MRNLVLFVSTFFIVAALMIAAELSNQPDYQAYPRPKIDMEGRKQ